MQLRLKNAAQIELNGGYMPVTITRISTLLCIFWLLLLNDTVRTQYCFPLMIQQRRIRSAAGHVACAGRAGWFQWMDLHGTGRPKVSMQRQCIMRAICCRQLAVDSRADAVCVLTALGQPASGLLFLKTWIPQLSLAKGFLMTVMGQGAFMCIPFGRRDCILTAAMLERAEELLT